MMTILSKTEKENMERKRQIEMIREYNRLKKSVFERRLDKFLKLYPYAADYNLCIRKFSEAVKKADKTTLNKMITSFNEENSYWSTYYVLHNCNGSIHQHIMTVLSLMHDNLAMKIQEIEEYSMDSKIGSASKWGEKGEKEVEYVLKWLTDDYYVIERECMSKYSNACILLKNSNFIDESQEYDHIVVGPQGIFLIETKNYSGKLYIDAQGNWFRKKKNGSEWMAETNPSQQIVRHHVLMESIIGTNVPIIDVICLAHPDIIASGLENSKVPIIKSDQLGNFIMSYRGNVLSTDKREEMVCRINAHKILK